MSTEIPSLIMGLRSTRTSNEVGPLWVEYGKLAHPSPDATHLVVPHSRPPKDRLNLNSAEVVWQCDVTQAMLGAVSATLF